MRPHMFHWLTWVFSCVAVLLTVLAAYAYFAPSPGPALEVAQTDLELGDCATDQKREVVFHLHNHSGRPMRVLGMVIC